MRAVTVMLCVALCCIFLHCAVLLFPVLRVSAPLLSLCAFPCARRQLNMGEGKTRVILPMLALHWADKQRIVRLNLLPTLIDEAYSHLHSVLTASVLGRKLFTLPFQRDVQLTVQSTKAMRAALNYCQQVGSKIYPARHAVTGLTLKDPASCAGHTTTDKPLNSAGSPASELLLPCQSALLLCRKGVFYSWPLNTACLWASSGMSCEIESSWMCVQPWIEWLRPPILIFWMRVMSSYTTGATLDQGHCMRCRPIRHTAKQPHFTLMPRPA